MASELFELCSKKNNWKWTKIHQACWQKIKDSLIENCELAQYDPDKEHKLMVDASSIAVGGMLMQLENEDWRPVSYFGAKLAKHQLSYTITEKECLAVVVGIKKYNHYLIGQKFIVVSDHHALCSLRKIEFKCTRLHRWANLLAQFQYTIEYAKGETHPADCFSRSAEWKHKKTGTLQEEDFYKYLNNVSEVSQTSNRYVINQITPDNIEDDLDEIEDKQNKIERIAYVQQLVNEINEKLEQPDIIDKFTMSRLIYQIHVDNNPDLKDSEPVIKDEQQKDPAIKRLIKQVNDGDLKQKFCIKQEVLYRRCKNGKFAIVLPHNMINRIFCNFHDNPIGGHYGLKPTLKKIKTTFWFPNMEEIIKNKISKCMKCIKFKPKTVNHEIRRPMPIPTKPFERIQIDIQGPYASSKRRNKYLIVAVDVLTKFVYAKAYPNQRSKEVIDFCNNLTTFIGIPTIIQTDNGPAFISTEVAEYMKENGIKHQRSSAYRPQSQGLVERVNGIIGTRIKIYSDRKLDWDEKIREIIISYNSTPTESLGLSPHKMLFNIEPQNPLLNHLNIHEISEPDDIGKIRENVREKLASIQEKRLMNQKFKKIPFQVGDIVAKKVHFPSKGKLTEKFDGKYVILEVYDSAVKMMNFRNHRKENSNFVNIKLIERNSENENEVNNFNENLENGNENSFVLSSQSETDTEIKDKQS